MHDLSGGWNAEHVTKDSRGICAILRGEFGAKLAQLGEHGIGDGAVKTQPMESYPCSRGINGSTTKGVG